MRKTIQINDFHRAVLRDYADGDFAYLLEQEEISREELTGLGDNLLAFMLIELSGEEDCEDVETAIGRLEHARDDLDVAIEALTALQAEMIERMMETWDGNQ